MSPDAPTHTPNQGTVHIPVLMDEVVAAIAPRDGDVIVDGTFGAGGYTRAFLAAAACTVHGIDRDPAAIARGAAVQAEFPGRLHLVPGCFGDMHVLLAARGVARVDGVALDLGVSSPQIDTPERGFSFRFDGPLDMRMGQDGPTAADVVNTAEESDLADILWRFGEERHSRRVARAIVARRQQQPFARTGDLADVIRSVVPKSKDGIDPATRSFQGLRIHVNDELGELERGLAAAERLLAPGGRLAVVSFHSLEDRVVKDFLRRRSGSMPAPSRHLPGPATAGPAPTFRLLSRAGIAPGGEEARRNPRARSSRLRSAVRTDAPAWSEGDAA
ncbi:MAG: S-adenosyl-methyltransferase MraW [Pseudomonadota bacterium]|jgi:16S rRNA (cytosine1402-N4)-methyltransferase